ncbi:MAG: hypothetical protein P4L79_10035 [Legionella sp.]|uniref:hypothetical protein n=1 Tax=Legionella sp. TaxID=459 RepID=UPI002843CEAF|nr:hypothetical protein [Legionella sp.]
MPYSLSQIDAALDAWFGNHAWSISPRSEHWRTNMRDVLTAAAAAHRAGRLEGLKMSREIAEANSIGNGDPYDDGDIGGCIAAESIMLLIDSRIAEIENDGNDDAHAK